MQQEKTMPAQFQIFGGTPIFLPHEINQIKKYSKIINGLIITGEPLMLTQIFMEKK